MKLTARTRGPFIPYFKRGIGFARHVFDLQGGQLLRYAQAFTWGGGTQILLNRSLAIALEASQFVTSLPNISGNPNRDKWDSSFLFTTAIALRF